MLALVDRLGLKVLAEATSVAAMIFVAATLLVILLELRHGIAVARYRTRSFANDVVYSAVYRGGLFTVLVWAAIVNVFETQLAFLRFPVLSQLPAIPSVLTYWIVGDFLLYWVHRLQHRNRWLWALHSVHHAQLELSPLSQSHRHPLELVINGLTLYLPLAFFLGLPTRNWVPWYVVAQILEALQHARLDWRFGPLYPLVVSPVFHSIHHSADPRHHDRNFGLMFSVWDYLFGTAAAQRERPERYGVDGLTVPESIGAQLVAPWHFLRRNRGTARNSAATRVNAGR